MKLVCRLFDQDKNMLGWTEHYAAVLGDGCLRASGFVTVPIDVTGEATQLSVHWVDINVEALIPLPHSSIHVVEGSQCTVFNRSDIIIKVGPQAGGLPPVTVKSVSIGVPVGALGASGSFSQPS